MTKAQHFGGGENAPPRTPRELKEAQMRANSQIICAVQPNADGHSLTVEIQKGALGAGKVLAAGGLEIQTYPGQTKSEGFKNGEFFAEGKLNNPKTGAYAGQVAIAGDAMGTDYSCIFKSSAEGAVPQRGQTLNQPVATPITPSATPKL
ncbi:MAG: hypothetical protein A3B66_03670 [Alphaproteobacteria bacterium RIFCSPHIGHO2_02_FULL_46_13]|nr:MAG: hypothetical protein A3B66_03670 [Alphaproteobacteria bacterium RIFCSPHIGHO2_02_FULL_46_13]